MVIAIISLVFVFIRQFNSTFLNSYFYFLGYFSVFTTRETSLKYEFCIIFNLIPLPKHVFSFLFFFLFFFFFFFKLFYNPKNLITFEKMYPNLKKMSI
jgi:hypothetical protein